MTVDNGNRVDSYSGGPAPDFHRLPCLFQVISQAPDNTLQIIAEYYFIINGKKAGTRIILYYSFIAFFDIIRLL